MNYTTSALKMNIVPQDFYRRTTTEVAIGILGMLLIRQVGDNIMAGRIVECEAYLPNNDAAAHTYGRKPSVRTRVLFGEPGYAYVYSIHRYHCLNIVTEEIGRPGCVLIRAVEPIEGENLMLTNRHVSKRESLTNGPGKLCQALQITSYMNGMNFTDPQSPIRIVRCVEGNAGFIVGNTSRIGVQQSKDLLLRFCIENSGFLSRPCTCSN